jgi:hypothetical protein
LPSIDQAARVALELGCVIQLQPPGDRLPLALQRLAAALLDQLQDQAAADAVARELVVDLLDAPVLLVHLAHLPDHRAPLEVHPHRGVQALEGVVAGQAIALLAGEPAAGRREKLRPHGASAVDDVAKCHG